MRNILLFVSYDGTDFCGWQRQEAVRTVQGVLEDALSRLHGTKVSVCGSGRTDSGVHAQRQAATFLSPIDSIPADRYPRAINCFLPADVRVTQAREVEAHFSARKDATSRVYRYFITTDDVPAAILLRYSWCIHRALDLDALNAFAGELRGEVDCASFAASDSATGASALEFATQTSTSQVAPLASQRSFQRHPRPAHSATGASALEFATQTSTQFPAQGGGAAAQEHSTCRYIERMRFFREEAFPCGNVIVFEIEANAYLYHMVRNLVGTLLMLESKAGLFEEHEPSGASRNVAKRSFERRGEVKPPASSSLDAAVAAQGGKASAQGSLAAIAAAKDRAAAGPTAPPQGLFLWDVKFDGIRRHV